MSTSPRIKSVFICLVVVAISSCASSSPVEPTVNDDREGYFAEPGDFGGVNFKPGQPAADGALLGALSGRRDQEALDNDLAILKKMPREIALRVVGFTDTKECSEASCSDLSLRRAKVVHDWLLSHGVSKSRLAAPYGFGSARPIGDNETVDGRARNRRAYISYEDVP